MRYSGHSAALYFDIDSGIPQIESIDDLSRVSRNPVSPGQQMAPVLSKLGVSLRCLLAVKTAPAGSADQEMHTDRLYKCLHIHIPSSPAYSFSYIIIIIFCHLRTLETPFPPPKQEFTMLPPEILLDLRNYAQTYLFLSSICVTSGMVINIIKIL